MVAPGPCSGQPATLPDRSSEVVAVVNGTSITESDIREIGALDLDRVARQFYDARSEMLNRLIADRLLEQEAARRGITRREYERDEVDSRVRPVSDADVDEIFAVNRERIVGDAEGARRSIRKYLEQARRTARLALLVADLRAAAKVTLRLSEPTPFRVKTDIAGAPVRGNMSAPVTIVEYSDFHCPFCRRVQPTLAALLAKYGESVRLVYKHFPLDGPHPNARSVSVASWCAGQQGKFWEFHDAVYADTSAETTKDTAKRFAKEAGVDVPLWTTCLDSAEGDLAVERDASEGQRVGVRSTPAFFVNGRELHGAQPIHVFERLIDEELKRSTAPASGTSDVARETSRPSLDGALRLPPP